VSALVAALRAIVGAEHAQPPARRYLTDATQAEGRVGSAEAVVLPADAAEVAAVVGWCYANDVAITPRGGGSGFSGGAVPDGGIALLLERLTRVRSFDPLLWRIEVEAGLPTASLHRLARENGLHFPPDPGAAEQSQIGGNIATNAGGPHAFKYGVTGHWVTGLEAVLAPGEIFRVGGPVRKDVAGYDLRGLLVGSEGTLGIVTAAWLRLVPRPEAAFPLVAFYPDTQAGCDAIETVLGSGVQAAAIEYLDARALAIAGRAYPGGIPAGARFMLLAEVDGERREAERARAALDEALHEGALAVAEADPDRVWRWRDGVSIAVTAHRGGKISDDIAVPLDRLAEAIEGVAAIGARHGVEAASWGHAGDGNIHASFLCDPAGDEAGRARAAAAELFPLAVELGGTISAEHGIGTAKRPHLALQYPEATLRLMRAVKAVFDPKGLLNPGKKV
jgi:glycolate oxidase subunit GlcD